MQNQIIEGYRLSPQQRHLWMQQADSELPTGSNSPCLSKASLTSRCSKSRCKILSTDTKYTGQVFAPFQECRRRFKLSKIARRSHSGSWILGRCAPASKKARLKTCFARPDLSRLIWKMVHCFVSHS